MPVKTLAEEINADVSFRDVLIKMIGRPMEIDSAYVSPRNAFVINTGDLDGYTFQTFVNSMGDVSLASFAETISISYRGRWVSASYGSGTCTSARRVRDAVLMTQYRCGTSEFIRDRIQMAIIAMMDSTHDQDQLMMHRAALSTLDLGELTAMDVALDSLLHQDRDPEVAVNAIREMVMGTMDRPFMMNRTDEIRLKMALWQAQRAIDSLWVRTAPEYENMMEIRRVFDQVQDLLRQINSDLYLVDSRPHPIRKLRGGIDGLLRHADSISQLTKSPAWPAVREALEFCFKQMADVERHAETIRHDGDDEEEVSDE